MRKQGNTGFLLWEALIALALLTIFMGSTGFLFRTSWLLFRKGCSRIAALDRAIEIVERGNGGKIKVVRGQGDLPSCRYRFVFVDGVWVCAKV